MMKSYYWLIGILITALLGILILQANYTLDNYRMKSTELKEEVNQLFAVAIQEEKELRKDSVLRWFRGYLSDTSKILLSVAYDPEENQLLNSIQDHNDSSPYTTISFSDDDRQINELDSANRAITIDLIVEANANYLDKNSIYYWTEQIGEQMSKLTDSMTLDTARLHRIFREQLQAHRIGTTYQLLAIPIDSTLSPPVGKKLYTEAYTTGLTRGDTKTFAQFENPFITVLRRARWSIFGSLAIISLTAGSFFIMLRIILRQKQPTKDWKNITLTKPPKRPNNT